MSKVGCAGILVADTFCGPMKELPREGQLMTVDQMPVKAGGCAANVAIDLAKQGIDVEVLGCLGQDSAATMLRSCFKDQGVGCGSLVSTGDHPTSKTVILLVEGQDRRYIHVFGANKAFTVEHIDRDWLATLRVFYLGGLFAMPGIHPDALLGVLKHCRERGIVTVVDVVIPQDFAGLDVIQSLIPYMDYFLPNDEELRQITGRIAPLDQLRVLQTFGANTVVVTQGHHGAMAARDHTFWKSGAHSIEVLDPSGAGDAFASGIIMGILRDWPMPQMLRYASAVGASAVRGIGTTDSVFTVDQAQVFAEENSMEVVSGALE